MKVLVLNSGSSSIKYRLFRVEDWQTLASGLVARIGEPEGEVKLEWLDEAGVAQSKQETLPIPNHEQGMERLIRALRDSGVLSDLSELMAIGHRVVHGGARFNQPALIDDRVIAAIRDFIPLAPLHNPGHLAGIEAALGYFPGIPAVAVFDTAFHQTMPPSAYRYAIPEALYTEHRIRRYGFHGTSHHYVAKRAAALLGRPLKQCNLITLHLGNGASATAIRAGQCIDTSMGLTPLEGLVMGTRSGDLDPGILIYLVKHLGLDADGLDQLLNRQSGLLGLCGVNDMREIHRLAAAGDPRAELAIAVSSHRLKHYIGAYYAELGRVDALVFTGGIGENDAEIRQRACEGLERLGIVLDTALNESRALHGERCISVPDGEVRVLVIPTNEELEIAQQALRTVAFAGKR
ncbi:acetate/propionate family kinase [Thermochromatium tepidum]|jgi:acetate kinase (EC 2.7.2.1)|uniref:Acetate kinase n=1 Tax=Thermochromatium tepidum ATCC 43061 TaxID=316276 RepID=A0A6I6E8R0_THETI|nr:acetate kinase [Thermochromatium tepidum]QGU31716.1 acetate/propionate family kinase [Thermochromatium tepidum ATCC 43061]